MPRRAHIGLVLLTFVIFGCAWRDPVRYSKMSGFLEDYSILKRDDAGYIYENPEANWAAYDKVLFDPVAIWRGGQQSLDPVAEDDLLRLAAALHHAVRGRLEEDYVLVAEPGPGVMRIRLALTEARESDDIIDMLLSEVHWPEEEMGEEPLPEAVKDFAKRAKLEGEITDAESNKLLAAGVRLSLRPPDAKRNAPRSWADVERAFDDWAGRFVTSLRRVRRGEGPL